MAAAPLWVMGAGGHAKVVVDTARAAGRQVAALVDRRPELRGSLVLDVPVLGEDTEVPDDVELVLAVGDNGVRARLAERHAGRAFAVLVHPRAVLAADTEVGCGTVVFANAVLQPGARVGRHAIVNTAAVIEHDCALADLVQVASGATLAGGVVAEEGAFVGAGATVLPGVRLGPWCVVGAGAVVVRDVPGGATVVGVPARELRR
ncbi:MAG TPA: acetyltransferase [Trueperaceae bacterium]